jgi:deoxyribodipyrimidine photolyase-related protein
MAGSDPADLGALPRVRSARRLVVVLGDQLDRGSAAIRGLDVDRDAVLMAEVREEAEHVPSHRQRTALFLSAMRHFALELAGSGVRLRYVRLEDRGNTQSLGGELARAAKVLRPEGVVVTEPGEHRVARALREAAASAGVPLRTEEDESFTCTTDSFRGWAEGRKELIQESFYRTRRRELRVLLEPDGGPAGGRWNYDDENRESFRSAPDPPRPYSPRTDAVTREVIEIVERLFPEAPGRMKSFRWPVRPDQARRALDDFVRNRLPLFGRYEDAMWSGEPVLYHSLLSSSLNLKLLHPRECVDAAVRAVESGTAPLNSVEGFVRQLIGWREFVRGVYFREGEGYAERNGLQQSGSLPGFFWDGETEMNCLAHCIGEVLDHGWGHHIPRLMVIGNFALIAGIAPRQIEEWFLAMYVDAVEWVTAPNVVGMSQHADGGVVGTKPYAASGKYIDRMSNYCDGCRFDVGTRSGPDACPFNTLYWDFLIRHRERFASNRRMTMMLRNVDRLDAGERRSLVRDAGSLRGRFGI